MQKPKPEALDLLLLVTVWVALLFIYRESFQLGFMHEDFAWAWWSDRQPWTEIFVAPLNNYFRPLASRLPYWIFLRMPAGLLWWKALSFLLVLGTSLFLWSWQKQYSSGKGWPLLASILWMHSPLQSFGLCYVNAFDYVLFPFSVAGFLWAIERKRGGWALAFLWVGLLSKELALVFPVLALVRGGGLSRRWHAAYWVSALSGFLWMPSLYSGHGVGGFQLALSPAAIGQQSIWLAEKIFYFTGTPWFWLAGLTVLAGGITYRFFYLLPLLLPLLFLNVASEYLGVFFWLILLGGGTHKFFSRAPSLALAAAVLLLAFFTAENWIAPYRNASHAYAAVLAGAEPFLARCPPQAEVVLDGLEVLGGQGNAEYGLWALRWRHPRLKFYLVQSADFQSGAVIPVHRSMWVEKWRTEGHFRLRFTGSNPFVITGEGQCAEDRHS